MAKQPRPSRNLPARVQPKLPGAARRSLALSNRGLEFLHKNDDGQKLDAMVWPASGSLPSVERRNVALWIREADRGEPQAQFNVGVMFFKGIGVERDYEEAHRWFLKSAKQGASNSQGFLGILYEQGLGVSRDLEESLRWYTLAVRQGNLEAQYNLGRMYYNGIGVEKNFKEAFIWYRKVAECNHAAALNQLGVMFEKGEGVSPDIERA
jgi:TPR repeat protein